MKQYKKDGKIYNLPIRIEREDNSVVLTNDQQLILKSGYEIFIKEQTKQTVQQLINLSDQKINKQTDAKILNDFVWNNQEFYLTMENQTNFANMYIASRYLKFPQQVKTKTGFYEIKNRFECERFYLARN